MLNKPQNKLYRNPWGDDHPEKIRKNTPTTIAWDKQLKGLLNFDKIFGREAYPETYPTIPPEERTPKRHETVLFSRTVNKEEEYITQESKLILAKLKEQIILLEKSGKNLAADVSKIKVEQMPRKSNLYFLRFLEWLLTVVRQLRTKVEDGRMWLATFSQRKKKRLGYWQMYKKHGTTFGLSHERTLATQTG